jgi:hypothetical protein
MPATKGRQNLDVCLPFPSTSTHVKVQRRPPLLSSRPKRSVGEGPAVLLVGKQKLEVVAQSTLAVAESETAGPSPTLRFGRDDKSGGRRCTLAWVEVEGQSLVGLTFAEKLAFLKGTGFHLVAN